MSPFISFGFKQRSKLLSEFSSFPQCICPTSQPLWNLNTLCGWFDPQWTNGPAYSSETIPTQNTIFSFAPTIIPSGCTVPGRKP